MIGMIKVIAPRPLQFAAVIEALTMLEPVSVQSELDSLEMILWIIQIREASGLTVDNSLFFIKWIHSDVWSSSLSKDRLSVSSIRLFQ